MGDLFPTEFISCLTTEAGTATQRLVVLRTR